MMSFYSYFGFDDEELLSTNILTSAIQEKEKVRKIANETIQKYYEKQKSIYQRNVCAVSYNIGGIVHIILTDFCADPIVS